MSLTGKQLGSVLFLMMTLASTLAASEFAFDCATVASCGKACRLVCETKKLTAVCYACECDTICIPGPSRPGCKHCAVCSECGVAECGCAHGPRCEFCWRDWFACGCASPRTVKVLTKHQAEKEIGWYHWEVVDASCVDCVSQVGRPASIYKAAPADAMLGDVLPLSDEEWSKLTALIRPHSNTEAPPEETSPAAPERVSVAERLGQWLRR